MQDCIFCKIIAGKTTTKIIYQDDEVMVFNDLYPKAPIHLLIIPKLHLSSLMEAKVQHQQILGKLLLTVNHVAQLQGLNSGYKIQINTGKAGGQEVYHLHLHLLGT